jgi:hypothetical protein
MAAYSWQDPGWSFIWSVIAAIPFIIVALLAPALLSLSSTVDMIAPIAEARAVVAGQASLLDSETPFYLLMLMGADMFADAPGRIHLVAKALGAAMVAYPLAYFGSTRFPAIQAALLTGALASFVAAPFAGPAEFGLVLFLACALCFTAASADNGAGRARLEGLVAGAGLFALWLLNPVYSLAGFVALSACPFLSGRCGLSRYAATLTSFAALAALAEYLAPGINLARASAASGVLGVDAAFTGSEGAMGLGGVAVSAYVVLATAIIFGGREHMRGWISALGLGLIAFAAARIVGANAMPVFVMAAAIACFSVASPFYDGLFRSHDRASVSVALAAASLTLFWTVAITVHSVGQFSLQLQTTKLAPENIRTELALVQPGGPTIAQWIEEGRFSTPEAREFFALAPVDQSAMLLEAASRARVMTAQGMDVAILTGADTACVLANRRQCHADGPSAATAANVVFVPRLELDPATTEAKGRMEALLYTDFQLVDRTAFWEIWVRRGAAMPAGLSGGASGMLYH